MADDKELEFALEERQRALHPSTYDKGFSEEGDESMGFDDEWGDFGSSGGGFDSGFGSSDGFGGDSFGGGSSFGGDSFGGGGSFGGGSSFGGGGFGSFGGFNSAGGNQQQGSSSDSKDIEEAVFDGLVKGGKATVDAIKKSGEAAKTFNIFNTRGMGKQLIVTGGLTFALGIVLLVVGLSIAIQFVVCGLFASGVGTIIFMVAHSKITDNNLQEPEPVSPDNTTNSNPTSGTSTNDNTFNNDFGSSTSSFDDSDWSSDNSGDASFESEDWEGFDDTSFNDDSSDGGSSSANSFDFSDDSNGSSDESFNSFNSFDAFDDFDSGSTDGAASSEEVLDSIDINNGVVTRQYIYEKLNRVLPNCNAKFSNIDELNESGSEFGEWLKRLNNAVEVLKPGADSREAKPQLISVKKKLFYYILEISVKGVKGIKPEALTEQLVSLYAYDPVHNKRNDSIYGTVDSVGGVYYIKIMRGETTSVSIKDIMEIKKDFYLDTKNEMPCALGIDIDGEPVVIDVASFDTLLITGEPRSGKSWCAKNILLQMLAFSSPEEVNFYIFDPKEGISDYNKLKAPHIKRFETTDESIVASLREVVKVEGPKRKKMLAEAGVYKIQEFRDKFPTTPFPYLYVLIDEVVTLAERMDKETKQEFQGLLTELVTQLPAAGIRLFMIPHVVKDDIIKKTITQNIPCRISVRGTPEHIELCAGLKPKDFAYKLTNVGDMAVNVKTKDGILQTFIHSSVVASSSDKADECFNFVDGMWRKICNLSPGEDFRKTINRGTSRSDEVFVPLNNNDEDFVPITDSNTNSVPSIQNQASASNLDDDFVPVTETPATGGGKTSTKSKKEVNKTVDSSAQAFSYTADSNSTDFDTSDDDLRVW